MISAAAVFTLLVLLVFPGIVLGHEVRPGYLEIAQTGEETFDVYFKVPARGDLRLSLYARAAGALPNPHTGAHPGQGRRLHRPVVRDLCLAGW